MAERIAQSTSYELAFKAYLAATGAEATGKTIAITLSKNGATTFSPPHVATNATEIANGWYFVVLDSTDTDTLGRLAVRGTAAAINDVGVALTVISATTGGATNLDAAISTRMATYTQPAGFLAATFPSGTIANTTNITAGTITTVSGNVTGSVGSIAAGGIAAAAFAANALDAVWSTATRILTAGTNIVLAKGTGVTGFNDPTANANADALLDRAAGVDTGLTIRQWARLTAAALLGKASGLGTTTATFRDTNDTKNRIVAAVDANGDRTTVTLDPT